MKHRRSCTLVFLFTMASVNGFSKEIVGKTTAAQVGKAGHSQFIVMKDHVMKKTYYCNFRGSNGAFPLHDKDGKQRVAVWIFKQEGRPSGGDCGPAWGKSLPGEWQAVALHFFDSNEVLEREKVVLWRASGSELLQGARKTEDVTKLLGQPKDVLSFKVLFTEKGQLGMEVIWPVLFYELRKDEDFLFVLVNKHLDEIHGIIRASNAGQKYVPKEEFFMWERQ